MKRLLVLEHESDSGIGVYADVFDRDGLIVDILRPGIDILPTNTDGYDALIVLGASPSVNDPAITDWFAPEVSLIVAADAADIPVFGICFGAQALAVALGGTVTQAETPEYGWKMIDTSAPSLVPEGPWFQWHVDAITPPARAEVLATSHSGVQAFRIGRHLGVQFHPEVGVQQAGEWPKVDPVGLAASGMTAKEHVDFTEALLPEARLRAAALWNVFIGDV